MNITRLTKNEIVHRYKWRCPVPRHSRHNGLEHPACYNKFNDGQGKERIGFLDIETEDLRADYGVIFCWCILDNNTKKTTFDVLRRADIRKYYSRANQPQEDTRIVQSLLSEMSKYDRLVGHYSSRFDFPFIRTRAIIDGLNPQPYGDIYQTDTWIILKSKFKLRRNTLENGHLKLLGFTRKDHLSLSIKHGCLRGEDWALKKSLIHCKKDVLDTMELYNKVFPYMKKINSSI